MIAALAWYGPDRMRQLIYQHLDPNGILGIEGELNFQNWPPKQLAVELESKIRAHGLLEQAVQGMIQIQAVAPDLRELGEALGVAAPGVTGSVASAIPASLRDEVIRFNIVFNDRRPQFQYLSAYKDLHDLLHTLQGMEEGISQAGRRFRERPNHPDELRAVANDINALAAKARRNYEVLNAPRRVGKWLEVLEQAASGLHLAAETNDPKPVTAQVEALRRLPGLNLYDLNIDLLESIERVNPNELARRMGTILDGLAPIQSVGKDFIASLRRTLSEFRDLCDKIPRVMDEHDACQAFETVVALAADNRGAILPEHINGWAKARDGLAAVVPEPGDTRAATVAKAAEQFEAVAKGENGPAIARELANLLGMFRPLFNEIDKKLLALTDHLVCLAAYIDVQLRNAAHV
jgi:hypothetical protein